jgi:prolyl-tRNA synthetase
MLLSRFFLPLIKETPKEAKIASHILMLKSGMIRQAASGIYTWLPLGFMALKNVEQIVRRNLDKAGCIEMLMPCVQPASFWIESGRYDDYGAEMLRIKDRHDNDLLFGPTAEELITDIFRSSIKSYKDLPKSLYQIQWKFRDEIRPRFGVMRGREFYMNDTYSFDIDKQSSLLTYDLIYQAYHQIFHDLDLKVVAVSADTGPIGGDYSHEFQVLADTGESTIYYDALLEEETDLQKRKAFYAAAQEKHVAELCNVPAERLKVKRGIEVGHIFYLGTKYSVAMNAYVSSKEGALVPVEMGCYGIGVSRLLGAIIQANHDDKGIIWPYSVAPFQIIIINLHPNLPSSCRAAFDAYEKLTSLGFRVLLDDTDRRSGVKFGSADLIGAPWQIIISNNILLSEEFELAKFEVKERRSGAILHLSLAEIINKLHFLRTY